MNKYFFNSRKKRRGKAREAKLNSISSPFVDDGILKTNPLLHSNNSNGDSKSINTPLVNQKEAMALFQVFIASYLGKKAVRCWIRPNHWKFDILTIFSIFPP